MIEAALDEALVVHERGAVEERVAVNVRGAHGDVDRPVVEAAAPPGMERLERREWNPADVAETDADSAASAEADESDQRGLPQGDGGARPGIPSPAVGRAVKPATVVIWGPAPRLGSDPRPTVGTFKHPAAVAVRRPVGADVRRHPHLAVRVVGDPAPAGVEIGDALHAGAHVRARGGSEAAHLLTVAVTIEVVEIVDRDGFDGLHGRAGSRSLREQGAALGDDLITLRHHHFGPARPHGEQRVPIGVHRDPITPGVERVNRDGRRVDVVLTVGSLQQAQLDRALRELDLAITGIETRKPHLHVVAQAHGRRTVELHFGMRSVTGRDVVLRQHRRVDRRVDRRGRVAALHRDRPIDEADPRDADTALVVAVRARGERRREGKGESGHRDEQRCRSPGEQ